MSVQGKCKFFKSEKGFGFVTRDDGEGDVFFHVTDLPDGIDSVATGTPMTFTVEMTGKGKRARQIVLE